MTFAYDEAVRPETTGPGRPLDAATRTRMERDLGADLSGVTVHTGEAAARAAHRAEARAYTAGSRVVFGAGQWAPGSEAGDSLLGHELAHVVQQRRIGPRVQRDTLSPVGTRDPWELDPWEHEADAIGRRRRPGSTLTYREARALPPAPPPPAASLATDPREAVIEADRPQRDRLLARLETAQSRIQALAVNPPSDAQWMVFLNDHVLTMLRTLGALIDELRANTVLLRFDQPATGTAAARYDYVGGVIHLRPLTDDASVQEVAASLVHEFTHRQQDRAAEASLATTLQPQEHLAADEIGRERDARANEVYFHEMARKAGLAPADFSAAVFHMRFETERRAATRQARAAARRDIDSALRGPYATQIDTNTPGLRVPVEISAANHAVLHHRGGTVDLGLIGPVSGNVFPLQSEVRRLVTAWSGFRGLFTGPGGRRYDYVLGVVVHGGRYVTEVGFDPP